MPLRPVRHRSIGRPDKVLTSQVLYRQEKGLIRYSRKIGHDKLIRVDFHGPKEVRTGMCHAILKAAGMDGKYD